MYNFDFKEQFGQLPPYLS